MYVMQNGLDRKFIYRLATDPTDTYSCTAVTLAKPIYTHTHYLPPLYVSADTHGTHGTHGTHAKFVHCSEHCILPIIYFLSYFFSVPSFFY